MSLFPHTSCAAFCASFVATSVLLAGCSSALTSSPNTANAISVTGNWQLSSTSPAAARLPALSGELTGTGAAITGLLHSDSATSCIAPSTAIAVSGSADANKVVTLTGTGLAGGTLTIAGTLAADGKSLFNATYNVKGGTCAFGAPAPVSAALYASITGNYIGTFSDPSGFSLSVAATLAQNPASDTTGNFQLSGTGTFNNACFSNSVTITSSQATGGSFDLTYTDPATSNSVDAVGTFSTDGKTLTVTKWTLAGPCGPDQGTGILTKQ